MMSWQGITVSMVIRKGFVMKQWNREMDCRHVASIKQWLFILIALASDNGTVASCNTRSMGAART